MQSLLFQLRHLKVTRNCGLWRNFFVLYKPARLFVYRRAFCSICVFCFNLEVAYAASFYYRKLASYPDRNGTLLPQNDVYRCIMIYMETRIKTIRWFQVSNKIRWTEIILPYINAQMPCVFKIGEKCVLEARVKKQKSLMYFSCKCWKVKPNKRCLVGFPCNNTFVGHLLIFLGCRHILN